MPETLLTILKFCLLALLYLFFFRVLRAVWAGLRSPEAAPADRAPGVERATAGPARLRVVEPPEQKGVAFDLADELTVGRAPGCEVSLDDTYVSQLHARIFRKDGRFFVEDLGSTNGTFVNRQKVSGPVALRRGDRVQVGRFVLEVGR